MNRFLKRNVNTSSVNFQTLFNLLSMIIRGGISYLTMPVFTRMLGTEQYGYYSVYVSWCGVFSCFMGMQCGSSLATRYYKYDDYKDFKSSLFHFCLLTCVSITFFSVLFINQIAWLTELPVIIVFIMLIEASGSFILSYASLGWIYEKKAQYNMISAIINAIISVFLSIYLIYIWDSRDLYIGRVIGNFLPTIIIAIFIAISILNNGSIKLKIEYIRYGLSYGIPIIFHMLSQYILSQSDRVMMQKMGTDMGQIGIYSFSYSFSMVLMTILSALGNAWSPFFFDGLKKKQYENTNSSVKNYSELFTILCCGFLLVAKEFGQFLGNEEFWSGIRMIPIFVLSVYCVFVYQFAVSYESFMEKPQYIAVMTMLAAVINIILNLVLIPSLGVLGASLATLISYMFLAIFHMLIIHIWRFDKYPLKKTPVIIGIFAVIISSFIFYFLYDLWIIRWVLAMIIGVYLLQSVIKRKKIF